MKRKKEKLEKILEKVKTNDYVKCKGCCILNECTFAKRVPAAQRRNVRERISSQDYTKFSGYCCKELADAIVRLCVTQKGLQID